MAWRPFGIVSSGADEALVGPPGLGLGRREKVLEDLVGGF